MRAPFEIGGRQVELSYAFGIVKLDPAQEKDLVGCALLASDRAVARGERWERYSDELDRESDWRLSIASELDRALAARDIRVVYQPKYSLHTDHIIRSEENTSELQSLMRISYAVFCLKQKKTTS